MTGSIVAAVFITVVLSGYALIGWGILLAAGRLSARGAAIVAGIASLLIVGAPAAGFAADTVRAPVTCGPGEECYDYILWWLAIPIGLALGTAVLIAGIAWGRLTPPKNPNRDC